MTGAMVLRTKHFVLAVGVDDDTLDAPRRATWTAKLVLVGDGMRFEAPTRIEADEIGRFGADVEQLLAGARTAASLTTRDGSLYLFLDRQGDRELGVAFRIRRDSRTGLFSIAETQTIRPYAEELGQSAKRFPYE